MGGSIGAIASRAFVASGIAGLIAVVPNIAGATADPTAAGPGPEVIAQALVDLDLAELQWAVQSSDVGTGDTSIVAAWPTFLFVGEGSPLLAENDDGARLRLETAEAVFRPSGSTSAVRALDTEPAELITIALGSGIDQGGVGETFAPGAGAHDVELLHDTLSAGARLTFRSELPALVYVLNGHAVIGEATELPSRTLITASGDVLVTNPTPSDVSLVIATIGPAVSLQVATTTTAPPDTPSPATAQPTTTAASSTTAPGPSTTASPTTTTSAPPATPVPVTAPPSTSPPDADGDGLPDSDEAALGTNPGVFDSDGDGLGDGEEVNVVGTNPTKWDTNGNGQADPL